MKQQRPILTITGSDSIGGSGIQADIRTVTALGGHVATAITAITVQTTLGIQEFFDIPASIVAGQIEAIFNDAEPKVMKIGMLRTKELIEVVAKAIEKHQPPHIVYDLTARSWAGDKLVSDRVLDYARQRLEPLATILIDESRDRLHPAYTKAWSHGLQSSYACAVAHYLNEGNHAEEAIRMAHEYVETLVVRHSDEQGRSTQLYHLFLDAISTHLQSTNGVQFYADLLNVSPRYLGQVTRRVSGHSPKQILDETLAEEAGRMLATSNQTIQEIAYHWGFSSQAHFSKFFRKMRGQSPSEYRKTTDGQIL